VCPVLNRTYGRGHWRKVKGVAVVCTSTRLPRRAEVHWYEAHGLGKRDIKIKRYLDRASCTLYGEMGDVALLFMLTDRKFKRHFRPAPRPHASAGGHPSLAAMAAVPAPSGSLPQRRTARRSAEMRVLDMLLRIG
jgi:hypothetical protein